MSDGRPMTEKERQTLVVAMALYSSTLKRERILVEDICRVLGIFIDELLTDYQTEIVPLIGRLSRPDWLAKQGAS